MGGGDAEGVYGGLGCEEENCEGVLGRVLVSGF